jgi:hypothetical protein
MNADAIAWARRQKTHRPNANWVLLLMALEADDKAMVEMPQSYLAQAMEVTYPTVGAAIAHLKRNGYIAAVADGNRWGGTIYHLNLEGDSSYIPKESYGVDMRNYKTDKARRERLTRETEDLGPDYKELHW